METQKTAAEPQTLFQNLQILRWAHVYNKTGGSYNTDVFNMFITMFK